ncbi:MAG: hypothetical protein QF394_06225 [Rhodospirillales bacterium]|nr:hypothetical protein [Rhodospirillales bacterium]
MTNPAAIFIAGEFLKYCTVFDHCVSAFFYAFLIYTIQPHGKFIAAKASHRIAEP